jgi:predicted nucleic acid-binding protein
VIVVDTQVLVYRTLPSPFAKSAEAVAERDPSWTTVPLWRSEFRSVLAGLLRRGELDATAALVALREAEALLTRTLEPSTERVLALVRSSKCSAYDLEFVALAEELGISLVTNDREVLAAFPGRAVSPAAFVA